MFSAASGQLLSLISHFLCQFEHALLITGIRIAMRGGLTVLLGDILIALLQLLYLGGQPPNILILLPDEFL